MTGRNPLNRTGPPLGVSTRARWHNRRRCWENCSLSRAGEEALTDNIFSDKGGGPVFIAARSLGIADKSHTGWHARLYRKKIIGKKKEPKS